MKRTLALLVGTLVTTLSIAQTTATDAVPPAFDVAAAMNRIEATLDRRYAHLEAIYKDIHAHPEMAFQESRTSGLLAAEMRKLDFQVTEHVGKTGVVALYKNGAGPTVLVRTEMDALPMEEKTGLGYASHAQQMVDGKLTFVDHACGHDTHMAWWVGSAEALLALKNQWHGTLIFVAQPAEEAIGGAKAMLADGLFSRFPKPDYAFAAHVGPSPFNTVSIKDGVVSSSSDGIDIVFHGRGSHGAMPDKGIDPIVVGARFVTDVQAVISRQKDPLEFGVITVGSFQAGTANNIIPDSADLKLTLRSFTPAVRQLLLNGVKTTAMAAAAMANAPEPTLTELGGTASVRNDSGLAARASQVMKAALGDKATFIPASEPGFTASEDFSEFVDAGVRSLFFNVGGSDPAMLADYKRRGMPVPVNHSPFFAPVPEPTIRTGVTVLTLAVLMVTSGG